MEKWDKLSMKDRSKYIQLAVSSGVTDLNNIKDTYNSCLKGENQFLPYNLKEESDD